MSEYGVLPTGFHRKPLAVILAEIEAQLITEFGPNVIQTSQSPLGQINGLMADLIAQLWELAEDAYQSYDVNQAEQIRLDVLGKLRLLRRGGGEDDTSYRQAITNQGFARIDTQDISRAIRGLPGVTFTQIFINDQSETDDNNLPPGSVSVAVLGGNDEDIAEELRRYIVPGVSTVGNTRVSTNIDGFCRSVTILRPILVPVKLNVWVRAVADNKGCPPPSAIAIRDTLVATLGATLVNGDDITYFRVRSAIESAFPNVEVLYFTGERDEILGGTNQPVELGFIELATVAADDVTVTEE